MARTLAPAPANSQTKQEQRDRLFQYNVQVLRRSGKDELRITVIHNFSSQLVNAKERGLHPLVLGTTPLLRLISLTTGRSNRPSVRRLEPSMSSRSATLSRKRASRILRAAYPSPHLGIVSPHHPQLFRLCTNRHCLPHEHRFTTLNHRLET